MTRLKSSWILDAAVVAVGLAAIALLAFSTRLTSTTLDRNGAWDQALGSLKLNVAMSDVWQQGGISGQTRGDARRQVYANLNAAQARCAALQDAGSAAVTRLCRQLDSFRALATRRLDGRRTIRQDRAYAASFDATLRRADEAQHAIALAIAGKRRVLNRVNAGIVILVLIVFAGMAVIVARRARQLAVHNERLRRLDGLKDNVMAAVSHELRTPLTSTIGFLQTLERSDLDLGEEERRELLRISRHQAERLAGVVDDLLFFAQVKTDKLRLSYGDVDIAGLFAGVRPSLALAREKGVSLQFAAEPVPRFRADQARLMQVLDNLVSNALKFTPRGGHVEVRAAAAEGRVLLEVADTGMGIPASEQPHLFDRFFRASAAVEQAIPGTGLGLAIVKAIVEAHQGVVTIRSEEARGTTVRVELPLSA